MSRKEFMEQLEKLLMDIPQEERIEALAYYNGYFEDAGEENEESIIRELESPEKVAKIIKADVGAEEEKEYTETGYEDARFHQQEEVGNHTAAPDSSAKEGSELKGDKALKVVLLVIAAVLTSPLWLGILGAVAGVILGVLGTILGILLAVALIVFVLYVAGVVFIGIGISMLVAGSIAAGLGLSGSGFLMLALAVLGTIGCAWLFGRTLPWLVRGTVDLCSRLFQGRRKAV